MTIEEKAKRYDEAFQIAKNVWRFSSNNAEIMRMEELFPELRESEDEKVRKALLRFHASTIDIDGIQGKEILAWLEKQGEHANFLNKIQIGDKVTRNEFGVLVNLSQLKRVAKPADKQGEKPRYSIGDILCDKSCTTLNKDTQPNFEIIDIRDGMYICDNGSLPISQQDEYELVAKKIEQKPQRMVSAEAKEALYDKPTDEEMKELLRTEYEKGRADTIAEMKSSWSEENEQIYVSILNDLRQGVIPDNNDIDWLKSIKTRITWKPNEKQVKALRWVLQNIPYNTYKEEISGLLDQIKKL